MRTKAAPLRIAVSAALAAALIALPWVMAEDANDQSFEGGPGLPGVPDQAAAAAPTGAAEAKPAAAASAEEEEEEEEAGEDSRKFRYDREKIFKERFGESELTDDRTEKHADRRIINLTAGIDRIVDLKFEPHPDKTKAFSVGNPKVLQFTRVKIGERWQVVLKPLTAGETTLTVRDTKGEIKLILHAEVTGNDLHDVLAELQLLLRDVEGINIQIIGKNVVIDGEVIVPADYGRIMAVLTDKGYNSVVLNLTTFSPIGLQLVAKKIQQDVNTFAANVKTRVVNDQIWIEGTVDSGDQAKRAQRIANLYIPEAKPPPQIVAADAAGIVQKVANRRIIQNFLVINPPPPKKTAKLVRITVHFVELSKSYLRLFGFKWQPGFTIDPQISFGTNEQGQAGTEGAPASFSGTISSLFPSLNSAQDAGYARVLKTGTVIVKSGQPAELNDTENIPFTTTDPAKGVTQASTAVGFALGVTPQILGQSEDIEMEINLKQSNVLDQAGPQAAPLTSEHNVKTKIYVKNSETAAVAAVEGSNIKTNFNRDDPQGGGGTEAGSTKAIFSLLRTKKFEKKKGQFVIFVTPQILEGASEGTSDLKKNFRVKVH